MFFIDLISDYMIKNIFKNRFLLKNCNKSKLAQIKNSLTCLTKINKINFCLIPKTIIFN